MIDKIKQLCNYSTLAKNITGNVCQIMYIDTESTINESYNLKVKMSNRDLAIDILLNNKEESEWDNREISYSDVEYPEIISPKVYSLSISGSNFTGYDDLYTNLIDFLETNTQNKKPNILDLKIVDDHSLTTSENFDKKIRKILSRIISAGSMVAVEGRIGPGNSVIVGKNNWKYIHEIIDRYGNTGIINSFNGISVIFDENISPDKLIICRSNKIDQPGLILIDDSVNSRYFFKETTNWDKQYCWFNIT